MLDIIMKMTDQNFCLIMKDDFSSHRLPEVVHRRVRIFNRVPPEIVRLIINSCMIAICTSYEETQHLSGIECAACNIPIVARAVGVYYDNKEIENWGLIADDTNFIEKINYVINNKEKFSPRECFTKYNLDNNVIITKFNINFNLKNNNPVDEIYFYKMSEPSVKFKIKRIKNI